MNQSDKTNINKENIFANKFKNIFPNDFKNINKIPKSIVIITIISFSLIFLIIIFYINKNENSKENKENYNELTYFQIRGYELNEPFQKNVYEYNTEVSEDKIQLICEFEGTVSGCNEIISLENTTTITHKITVNNKNEKLTYTIKINKKIDEKENKLRIVSIDGNPLVWTNKDVIIKVNAKSIYGISEYSFNEGKNWQISNEIQIKENKTLILLLKDNKGNITNKKEIIIDKIDKEKPNIKVLKGNISKKEITLNIIANDNLSGIDEIIFNNKKYQNTESFTITKPGTYSITAKDKAGNISKEETIIIKESDFKDESAIITKTFTATFDNNINGEQKKISCKTNGDSCEIVAPQTTKDGYDILGWSLDKNDKKAKYNVNDTIILTKNITYYAITKKDLKLTLNKNNNQDSSNIIKICSIYNNDTSCSITLPEITRNGYSILGWSLNKDNKIAEYKENSQLAINKNTTLYAITKKDLTLMLNNNGANHITNNKKNCSIYNSQLSCSITLPEITRDGFVILGWSLNKDAKVKDYNVNETISISNDTTYYAITKKDIKLYFKPNGANSISSDIEQCTIYNSQNNCSIYTPKINKNDWEILGWSANPNSKTSTYKENNRIEINNDNTYYAITKKTITITFDSNVSPKSCNIYNQETSCNITLPEFIKTGSFNGAWGENQQSPEPTYVVGKTIQVTKDKNLYASIKNPYSTDTSKNYAKIRNLNIQKTTKIGNTTFEYENGIPEFAINNHITLLNRIKSELPYLLVPGKAFIFEYNNYDNYSIAYGLTMSKGSYMFIDLKYDSKGLVVKNAIDPNATIHELAHAWDNYYSFKTNKGRICNQTDFTAFYNSISDKLYTSNGSKISKVELFAAMVTNYYWHILGYNQNIGYYGLKTGAKLSEAEKTELKNILEKYIKISNNNYNT